MVLFLSPSSSAGVESLPKIAFLWGKRPHCLITSLHASGMHNRLSVHLACHHKSLPVFVPKLCCTIKGLDQRLSIWHLFALFPRLCGHLNDCLNGRDASCCLYCGGPSANL